MSEPDFDTGIEFPDDTGNIFLMRRKYGQIWLYRDTVKDHGRKHAKPPKKKSTNG